MTSKYKACICTKEELQPEAIKAGCIYLTTDTDYDELAKELGAHEPGTGSYDPFADVEDEYAQPEEAQPEVTEPEDDLDEYAKWAAEAAAKATSGEMPVTPAPKPHKPIPMPVPESLKHTKHE